MNPPPPPIHHPPTCHERNARYPATFLRVRPARSSFRCFSAARSAVHSAQAWKHARSQRPSISSKRRRAQLGSKEEKKERKKTDRRRDQLGRRRQRTTASAKA